MQTNGQQHFDHQCIICLQIADRAVVAQCCAVVLCLLCYQKLPEKTCPNCRHQNFEAKQQKFVRKQIYNICPQIQVIVKTLSGKSYALTLKEIDLVETMKKRIVQRQMVPIQTIYLIHNGRALHNETSLRQSQVKNLSTVYIVARLKGGILNNTI